MAISSSSFVTRAFVSPSKVQLSVFHADVIPPFRECHSAPAHIHASSRIEVRPLLDKSSLRVARRLFNRCSRFGSIANVYNETGLLFSFFRELGLNEEETKLLLDRNPTLRSISLHMIQSRVNALQSLGIKSIALSRLIAKSSNVVFAEEIDPLISFLLHDLRGSIEPAQLERLFSVPEPRFLDGFDQKVNLLLHHGVPQEKLPRVLNNVNINKAFCFKTAVEIESMVTFLKPYGGTDLITRRPAILNCDFKTQLIPRVLFIKQLSGEDEDATGTVLRKLPAILSYSVEHFKGHVGFLRSYAGLSDQEIFKIFLVFPNMISASKDRKLQPRIRFLKQCGLNSNDIFKFLTRAPLFLALSFEGNLAHKLSILVKIGYEFRTKELALALGAVTRTSCENLQKVITLFLGYGFSCADILAMSKKHPQVLQYNPSSLEEKMEFLIEEMGREVGELLTFPAFLGYKLDDRIKHRYEVKKKTIGEGMSLNKLLTVSADRFSSNRKASACALD